MKIAIFTDSFYPSLGGMEDATALLAQALGERGHQVIVFAPYHPARSFRRRGLPVGELDLGERVKVKRLFSLPIFGKIPGGRIIIPLGLGYYHLKKERPDIIHTQSIFGAGLEALVAVFLLKVELIGTNHSILSEFVVYSPFAKKLFVRLANRYEAWFYNHCRFISTASRAVFSVLTKSNFKQSHQLVSNIVDIENFRPADSFPSDSLTIVYAGRFALEKRGEILLRALALVKNKIPQAKLVLAGSGPEEGNWRKIIKELKIESNVQFAGNLTKPQLAQLFRQAKVFAIASAIENQSMVVLQAMASGLPVVGVNGRGMPEIVKDSQNGFIVPVDDYRLMAERIVGLLQEPELAFRLGQQGRQMVESHTGENVAIQWEKIYQTVLSIVPKLKLSIVIPAYNEEARLAECLKIVLTRVAEQGRDVEIVLVNNASTDRTGEIARSFVGVKVVDELNKGLVRARQAGFLNSTGDLIANVDADSRIPAGWIEKIFKEFEHHPNLVALSGPYTYYDLPAWFNGSAKIYYALGLLATYLNLNPARRGAMLQGGNFTLRRAALEKIGGYRFEKFDFYGEETDVAMRICEVGKIKFTFSLSMVTSGRRMSGEGMLRVAGRYAINYFWTILFGRPYTKTNLDIRTPK